jgi:hypothetical protein
MRTLALVLLLALVVVAVTPAPSDAYLSIYWWMGCACGGMGDAPDGPSFCTCWMCTGFARIVVGVAQLGVML